MKKIVILSILLSIISMLIILINNDDEITTNVFQIGNGFGYSIASKHKVLIKQNFIPAIQEQTAFCSKEDALAVAEIVKYRLENNLLPSITFQDLRSHNIRINCK